MAAAVTETACVAELCASLLGAEDALVVNNNAASVLLCATALGQGRDVIVSRGELVEIGGGFPYPRHSCVSCGARLIEVGTTNRTRIGDFERALTPNTAMLLKVHRSNFAVSGFTSEAATAELVALGRTHGIPMVEDLGSGAMVDPATYRLPAEPLAKESIAAGVSLVMFSGDKLFGGPQAGIVVGRHAMVESLRRHPLARALRPGRLVFAALEATLRIYAEGRAEQAIPIVSMLAASEETVHARATRLLAAVETHGTHGVKIALEPSEARVGGGAMPTARIPSWAVTLDPGSNGGCANLVGALRDMADPPVIARVAGEKVILDARTIGDDEISDVAKALAKVLEERQKEDGTRHSDAGSVAAGVPLDDDSDEGNDVA